MSLPNEAYMPSPLIWLCWLRATFLGRCCAVLANLNSLPCLFNLWRYPGHHASTSQRAVCLQGSWHFDKPTSQAFFRGVTGNLRWPCNSYMLHASKISIGGVAGRCVPICMVGQVLLDHTCSALVIRVTEKWSKSGGNIGPGGLAQRSPEALPPVGEISPMP